MCITRLHNLCIDEGYVYITNAEDIQGNETWFVRSDINEKGIAGNSVHWHIIVQSLERPSFN